MSPRARLVVVDAPGGPHPSFYLPRLSAAFDVRVLYAPPGSERIERDRVRAFSCPHVRLSAAARAAREIEAHAGAWRAHGILAFSERVVHAASEAATALGLPASPAAAVEALRDKRAQRAALAAAGIPVPRHAVVDDAASLAAAIERVGLPAVLKPAVGMGSVGVSLVTSPDQARAEHERLSALYRADAKTRENAPVFMLEAPLRGERAHDDARIGDHVSVESVVAHGVATHIAVTDKLPLAHPFRETGDVVPSTHPAAVVEAARAAAGAALAAVGMTTGAAHTELKLTLDGPRVIEVNGRIGGGVAETLELAAGYDVVTQLGRVAVGGAAPPEPAFARYAAFLTPQPPARPVVVARVAAPEELAALDGVVHADVVHGVGARPDWRAGTGSHVLRVLARHDDWGALMALAETVAAAFEVRADDDERAGTGRR